MKGLIKILFFFTGLSGPISSICSQERLIIPRITEEIRFDGIIDDPCWKNITPLALVMHTPTFGNQPSEKK